MGHATLSARSTRVILALLLLGSMSGFVLGQELHHPAMPIAHIPHVITAHAAGSLGTSSVLTAHSIKNVTNPAPVWHNPAPKDSDQAEHSHHTHHHKGGNTISFTQYFIGPISPQHSDQGQSHGGGNDSGGD